MTPVLLAAILATGCASSPVPTGTSPAPSAANSAPNAAATPQSRAERTLVAIVDGRTSIEAASLEPSLVELGGQTALREQIVDARLARRLDAAGITIDKARLEREERLLLETLSDDASRAIELLGEIRARQGLGPVRFAALLKRNAGLRALVERDVAVDEEGLANMFDMLHGPKRVARIAVLASLGDAQRFAADAAAGDGGVGRFAELAVERSLDDSAARGGLLAPVARRDPSYPEALRAAIFATEPGKISAPVLDGARFYVVLVTAATPAASITPDEARARCERMLRLSRERLLMDALARELASSDGVTIFDRAYDAQRP
ncbi:MAG: hypothetical protein RLY21_570 [Planctomycetota bacterium]|jgi:hypothetical protein